MRHNSICLLSHLRQDRYGTGRWWQRQRDTDLGEHLHFYILAGIFNGVKHWNVIKLIVKCASFILLVIYLNFLALVLHLFINILHLYCYLFSLYYCLGLFALFTLLSTRLWLFLSDGLLRLLFH